MIILPVMNIHRLKRYLGDWLASSNKNTNIAPNFPQRNNSPSKCCVCALDAVIPQHIDACSFCYYCLQSNKMADPNFRGNKNCPHFIP